MPTFISYFFRIILRWPWIYSYKVIAQKLMSEFSDGSKQSSTINYSAILKHVFGVSAKNEAV